jgi:magnesium transporter
MFRVMELRDGKVDLYEGSDHVGPPPEGTVRWIDLQAQDAAQLELLRERFDFHPLPIEDCAHLDQRPKLEEYRDCLFVVTQGFVCVGSPVEELVMHEMHSFLGARFLVTVHATAVPSFDKVWKRAAGDPALLERGADFICYLVTDGIVDECFPILDVIADELEALEDAVMTRPQRSDLARIFELKHHLVAMRRVLSPQRDVLAMLSKRGDKWISERSAIYFRNVYDHLSRINESIEAHRDLLGNALEAYLGAVAQRTNEIMKALTIMSAVFLPLAFVVGFFGQNFDNFPGLRGWIHSDGLMWAMIAMCVSIPVTLIVWFRRKGWL